ncbi:MULTISPECIES: hypothetical protein [unclassified Isoptericola]|uniref:hypothetical protein n=1 Tax=unclassified Isoptericola TaxID=2623355 RepID=UPI003657C6FF
MLTERDAPDDPGPVPDPPIAALTGFDAGQDAVYRQLVDQPGSTVADLLPPEAGPPLPVAVAATLERLVTLGLAVAEQDEDAVRYRATSPTLALAPLLDARRAALREVEEAVAELTDRHRAAQSRTGGGPVEVVVGQAAIRRRLLAMQHEARHQVRTMMPAPSRTVVITFADNFDEAERGAMERGVVIRTVMDVRWLDEPASLRALGGFVELGQHIRVSEDVPIKLVLADDDVALLPLDPMRDETEEPVSLVVHRSGLLTALSTLFEQSFRGGWPLGLPRDDGEEEADSRPDVVDRRILALLRVGLTDAAIAHRLGMGHRTVQRRLQTLMSAVGATTRFQLGWRAADAGWLDTVPPS